MHYMILILMITTTTQSIFKNISLKRNFDGMEPHVLLLVLQQEELELNEDELYNFVYQWLQAHPQLPSSTAAQVCPFWGGGCWWVWYGVMCIENAGTCVHTHSVHTHTLHIHTLHIHTQLLANVSYAAMSSKALRRVAQDPPAGVDPKWLHEALACKEDALLLSEVCTGGGGYVLWGVGGVLWGVCMVFVLYTLQLGVLHVDVGVDVDVGPYVGVDVDVHSIQHMSFHFSRHIPLFPLNTTCPHPTQVAPERRRRVPTPVIMLYGRGWFKSRHALELVLHEGAKKDGCVLDLQAASSYATVSEQRGRWYVVVVVVVFEYGGGYTYTHKIYNQYPGLFDATKQFHVEVWVCPCYLSQRDPCFGPILGKHSTGAGWELRMGRDGIQMMVTLRKRQMTWHEVVSCNQDVQLGMYLPR